VSATVELAQPLDPRQRLGPGNATVAVLPDSTPVKVVSVLPKPLDDSLHAPPPARPDTAAADTSAAPAPGPGARRQGAPGPTATVSSRPPLSNRLVVRVREPWKPGGRYAIEVRGVRNVTGTAGDVRGTLAVPDRTAGDSVPPRPPSDSLAPAEE
jgi:hypothetical protein